MLVLTHQHSNVVGKGTKTSELYQDVLAEYVSTSLDPVSSVSSVL